jgi:hypothetical protein
MEKIRIRDKHTGFATLPVALSNQIQQKRQQRKDDIFCSVPPLWGKKLDKPHSKGVSSTGIRDKNASHSKSVYYLPAENNWTFVTGIRGSSVSDLDPDPDPIRIQGFDDQKFKKKLQLKKCFIPKICTTVP